MQQCGTLRKRRKRNIAKVNGLSAIPYDEAADHFDGVAIFDTTSKMRPDRVWKFNYRNRSVSSSTSADTRIQMPSFLEHKRISRITRNPMFHDTENWIKESDFASNRDSLSSAASSSTNINISSSIEERSHLLGKSVMNRLHVLLLLGATSGSFPWYWNRKEYRIEKGNAAVVKVWWIQWLLVSIQTGALTLFQIWSFVTRVLSVEQSSYRGVFMNSLCIYWYMCALFFNVNMYLYQEQIRSYINTLLDFNQKYVDKYLIQMEDYKEGGRLLTNLAIPSNVTQVFVSVILFFMMPNQPWYLYSYIAPPKPWYWAIPGALQQYILIGQVITSYLLISWIVVAHTNSVQFWLMESHNNNHSDYTSEKLRRPQNAVEMYRALQILTACFNECMSPMAIMCVKITAVSGIIPCGYVLIRSMNRIFVEEFPGILSYPIGVIDCASAAFAIMQMAAEMHDLAVSFTESWSRTRQKNFRRILMSCSALKLKVCSFYFITVSTTITLFKVTFDFITDCVITFP